MVKITGLNGNTQDTGFTSSPRQHDLPVVGSGWTALRDKDTGEIFVPSTYYNTADGSSTMYWDSEKNEIFSVGTWTMNGSIAEVTKNALRTRFRKELDKYELIAFNMKDGELLPYLQGHKAGTYNAGPCPMDRTTFSNVNEIVVLCKTMGKTDEGTETGTKTGIEMLEVKEV